MRHRLPIIVMLIVALSGIAACNSHTLLRDNLVIDSLQPTQEQNQDTDQGKTIDSTSAVDPVEDGKFSRAALISDVRQLAQIIEDTHPDPYIRGGGKVAFHLRLSKLLEAIPQAGMTQDEFIKLVRPFLAAIGDSHTEIWTDYSISSSYPGGIPLKFGISETSLYVAGVLQEDDQSLFGARLISVEGILLDELLNRQAMLVPLENEYHVLEEMASRSLWYKPYLQDLLPEWGQTDQIKVELLLPSGEDKQIVFSLPIRARKLYHPETEYELPSVTESGFGYKILDLGWTDTSVAYLRVDHMQSFLEDSEATGISGYHIQSATETFRDLAIDMKAAGTDTLIIDLRKNGGGSSLMSDILIYFLYGKDILNSIQLDMLKSGGQVYRYSAQCFTPPNNIGKTLDQVNEGRDIPIELGGYDFTYFFSGDDEEFDLFLASMEELPSDEWYRASPTFNSEYESEAYSGYYLPDNIFVLISPWTFSSGLTMARDLYQAGAVLVGTPSAQSSNSFSNGLMWHLNNTGLEGQVTRSYTQIFPGDSGLGLVLPVHYQLSYIKLASYEFDPNAEFLFALELIPEIINYELDGTLE